MIYLDHAATSPMLPEVIEAMAPWLGVPANPASVHGFGQRAASALETARGQVAALLERDPKGIVFGSGATEANHAAVHGFLAAGARRFAAAKIEHPSLLAALQTAPERVWLPVSAGGVVLLEGCPPVDVLTLMAVNHEVGTVQPVAQAVAIADGMGARTLVDASQGASTFPLPAGVDAVVLSAHKLGGPVGIGVLSLRDGRPFAGLLTGGGQERGRRAGTGNVAAAVGFGAACLAAKRERLVREAHHVGLAETLRRGVQRLGGRIVGVSPSPAITCAIFSGVPADLLVAALDLRGIAASAGAACASGSVGPSPVLEALGESEPRGGLRISLGPGTTSQEIAATIQALEAVLPEVRGGLQFGA